MYFKNYSFVFVFWYIARYQISRYVRKSEKCSWRYDGIDGRGNIITYQVPWYQLERKCRDRFLSFFSFHYYLRPFILSLLIIVVTQIRGDIAGSSPLPTTVRALHFIFFTRRFQLFHFFLFYPPAVGEK